MAQAVAKRKPKAVCGANTKRGGPCTRRAGAGTDHFGKGRCSTHGGNTANGKTAIAKADAQAHGMATSIRVTPGQAVQGAMFSAAGEVAYATAKVAELPEAELMVEGFLHPWLRVKHGAEERLVKFAKAAADMGIEAAKLRIAEAQTAMMGKFLEGVMGRLNLTAEQKKALPVAIREELAVVTSTAAEVE